jgi:hypothetical protein
VIDVSDGPHTGPAGERAGPSGKPPVPGPLPADPSAVPGGEDGQHRTERVPFPLPAPGGAGPGSDGGPDDDGQHRTEQVPFPLPSLRPSGTPVPAPGPETGRLYLGGYPPRVPGAARPGPADPTADEPDDDGAGHDR